MSKVIYVTLIIYIIINTTCKNILGYLYRSNKTSRDNWV